MLQAKFNCFMQHNFDNVASSTIALSVSGGSDSIALLFLASKWAKNNLIQLIVFSVDHQLRHESSSEIQFVQDTTIRLGHKFIKLTWNHNNQTSAIQEKARIARYTMITHHCHKLGIYDLLTAHHHDDFLETYYMRRNKNSGLLGLSNSFSTFYNNIQVLRPLYNIKKQALINYLEHNSIQWIEDTSNSLDQYERNRVRKYILSCSIQDKILLEKSAHIANIEANKLNNKLIEAIAENIELSHYGFAILNIKSYQNLDNAIQVYLINFVLTVISGKSVTPRYRSTKLLLEKIMLGKPFIYSLHGCIIHQIDDRMFVFREHSRISNHRVSLKNGMIWDNRFKFILDNTIIFSGLEVSRMYMQDYTTTKDYLNCKYLSTMNKNHLKIVLFTLPVIKKLEKIIAIPHIPYYDNVEYHSRMRINVIFNPAFVSRFTHFL